MNFPFKQKVFSEAETFEIANGFAEHIKKGDIVALTGNLGSGKTFFVKSVCSKFNITEVSSPSFSIINEYEGKQKVFHFDFYRIKKIEELYDIGFDEYVNDPFAITFIEWSELFPELIPKHGYQVVIELNENSERTILIESR